MSPRCLLVDNYDSYSYNLFQLIAVVNGGEISLLDGKMRLWCDGDDNGAADITHLMSAEEPIVCNNDGVTVEQIRCMIKDGIVGSIVISPGPGTPACESDIGKIADWGNGVPLQNKSIIHLNIQNVQYCTHLHGTGSCIFGRDLS